MESVQALSNTNLTISEAKNTLFKLQETETEYLVSREEKAMDRIKNLLENSKELLDETTANHAKVKEYTDTVDSFAQFLKESHEKFSRMLEIFNERNELWDKNIKNQEQEIAKQRKLVELDTKKNEENEKRLKDYKKELEREKEYIESRQATLSASYEVEKKLWNKISQTN